MLVKLVFQLGANRFRNDEPRFPSGEIGTYHSLYLKLKTLGGAPLFSNTEINAIRDAFKSVLTLPEKWQFNNS